MARALRRSLGLVVVLPLACATPREGAAPPAPVTTTPAPPAVEPLPVDFSRVLLAQVADERWRVEHGVHLPQAQRERLFDGLDGIERKLDPAAFGITVPFAEGDALVLVTEQGTLDSRIVGLGAWVGSSTEWITGVLEVDPGRVPASDRILAVLGPRPHPDARLRRPTAVPLGPRVGLALHAARAELPALEAGLREWMAPEERSRSGPLHVDTACGTAFMAALPPGFEQVLLVHCNADEGGDDPRVTGLVVLGEHPQVLYPWSANAWHLSLHALVDLDGDGIDELWIDTGGHEWSASTLWRWDGQRYVDEEIIAHAL
jgi:hypothetical protein